MLDVEVFGEAPGSDAPSVGEVRRLCDAVAASAAVEDGHVAIEFVDERRIAELNATYRGRACPTDVLSFPIDGAEPLLAPESPIESTRPVELGGGDGHATRELGDVIICPAHTGDLREAIVHGMLHLLGMDHEVDDGEMLALQQSLLRRAGR
jgi:probable rRNA maturation factor